MITNMVEPVLSPIDEYRAIRAMSQSALKRLDYDVRGFYEEEEKWLTGEIENKPERASKAHFDLGNMVDTMLTRPEDFKKDFAVYTGVMPTGQMLAFTLEFFRLQQQNNIIADVDKSIDNATIAHFGVGIKRDSVDKIIERFKTEGLEFYAYLKESVDKTTVPTEQYFEAVNMVKALREDEFTKKIVLAENTEKIQIYHQYIIQGVYHGVPFKGLIDKVIINNENKTIELIDYKTCSDSNFEKSFLSFRYDIQASLYQLLFQLKFGILPDYKQHVLMPFKFVVAFTTGRRPEVWETTPAILRKGMTGGKTHRGMRLKGVYNLVHDYLWHKENNKWKYPKEVYEKDGHRVIDCYE